MTASPVTAFPLHNASAAEWADWRWQMRHRVRDPETLARYIRLTDGERAAIAATAGVFRWTITPYYASLMDGADPACPVRRHVVPAAPEVAPGLWGQIQARDLLHSVAEATCLSGLRHTRSGK